MASDHEKVQRRLAEQILNDESLTEELDDDDANTLIDWGLAQVEAIAQRPAPVSFAVDADAAEPEPEDQAKKVRKLMKRVSRLVARRANLSFDELQARLAQLTESEEAGPTGAPSAPGATRTPDAAPLTTEDLANPQISNKEIIARLLAMASRRPPTPEGHSDEQET
jgi:hypothetical protein